MIHCSTRRRATLGSITMRMLFLAIVAATVASCSCAAWWETALIYQIYPRSYKDSNGDGIGDLNGITEKLPYLKETGVDAIWMSPIFLSPMYDFGYDIADYRQIAPEYGTMADFDHLLAEAKKHGIRVVLDFVPNHTSNESDWFIKSANRDAGYEDYYVWADGVNDTQGVLQPPNNWLSVFSKSAWEYNTARGQYYLHQFVIGQPDLNYRNSVVQQEMKDVLSFWLNKGVSGFRIDAVNFMYEVDPAKYGGKYPDEPRSNNPSATPDDYEYLNHIYSKDLDETYGVVYDWRDLLDTYLSKDGESKVMMTEAYADLASMIRYYGNDTRNGSLPFNFLYLGDLNKNTNAKDVKAVVDRWMNAMPAGKTANWVNGNHDQSRLATRHGVNRVDSMNMIALLLPGLTITYQGEELGMTDGVLTWEQTVDPQACNTDDPMNGLLKSRDPARTPFHWDATKHAGFSNTSGTTWLPVADNYATVNVAVEMQADNSHYKFYKDVVAIKKTATVREGDLETTAISDNVFVITRSLQNVSIVAIANLGNNTEQLNLSNLTFVPDNLKVVASGVSCELKKGDVKSKADIAAVAHCAIVFESTDALPNNSVQILPSLIIVSLLLVIVNQMI